MILSRISESEAGTKPLVKENKEKTQCPEDPRPCSACGCCDAESWCLIQTSAFMMWVLDGTAYSPSPHGVLSLVSYCPLDPWNLNGWAMLLLSFTWYLGRCHELRVWKIPGPLVDTGQPLNSEFWVQKITIWRPSQNLESSGPARLAAKKADDIKVDQKWQVFTMSHLYSCRQGIWFLSKSITNEMKHLFKNTWLPCTAE